MAGATVSAVHRSTLHSFSKFTEPAIRLIAGLGVEDDAHAGTTVQHRSRVARNPGAPNLRQVHLIHAELFDELMAAGFAVWPGDLGENLTTQGIALLDLPTGTRLHIGSDAVVELTGLRNPCSQIDRFQRGLMAATLARDAQGELVRKAGVMAVVCQGGEVRAGDAIRIEMPAADARRLEPV
ncbi:MULTISPECIES: MOSC domain-containing protein [unclassified Variovorax]|uniref:MOSC domain-containing protein n=1 Tax=unclassified Variovorax TaxID=663243 RepID=UPI0025762AE6|nr:MULTISPECIES: MOSC domain-containing protein [unclassified Variovorax]MDM0086240.1 MOSC domain-containing protein [Variovorax sp. J22G40]MDM0145503.1 MOSC domain-containing protein [Variovorax sp. J2P1-31]